MEFSHTALAMEKTAQENDMFQLASLMSRLVKKFTRFESELKTIITKDVSP